MAKNVIILGAGASAGYGAPVMRNFLDVAAGLHASGKAGKHTESFKRVFEGISRLQAVHSKAEFDLVNLESIFTAFELAKTLGKFPGKTPAEIDQMIDDLRWVIVSTLQTTVQFPCDSDGQIMAHVDVRRFIESITRGRDGDTAILTFNYDLIFDIAISRVGIGIDYGLRKEPNRSQHIPLLKLHGSLNWTNSTNDEVVPWFLSEYLKLLSRDRVPRRSEATVQIADQFEHFKATDSDSKPMTLRGVPVIVPPSWNKADSHRAVSKVWSRAALELSNASSIFVVGYSLPETDSFFRQLYALGTVGETLLERFWVFNPDKSRETIFRSMLGPGARERFQFFDVKFDKAMDEVTRAIRRD